MLTFKHWLGECDSKEWISPKLSIDGFTYWLVVKITNLLEVTGEAEFYGELEVTTLDFTNKSELNAIQHSMGYIGEGELEQLSAVYEYGRKAQICNCVSVNPLEAMARLVKWAGEIDVLEALEMPFNRLGTPRWNLLKSK